MNNATNWPNVSTAVGYQLLKPDSYSGASCRLDKIPKPGEFLLLTDSDGSYYRVRQGALKEIPAGIAFSIFGCNPWLQPD